MIDRSAFAQRRQQLLDQCEPGSVVILSSAKEQVRNSDVMFPFRQNSDFYYLTGFPEDDAIVVLRRGVTKNDMILFCKVPDPVRERWTGPIIGQTRACQEYGANEAYPIGSLAEKMPELLANHGQVYSLLEASDPLSSQLIQWLANLRAKVRTGVQAPDRLMDLRPILHEMRLHKSAHEIELMRKAAAITAHGHLRAMQTVRPNSFEYQLEAELVAEFIRHGAREQAYPPIVGSGANSCILHYGDNVAPLLDGDLVLIDAGCEWQCYASDVTRTLPVNGRFSPEQKAIYELVLEAQTAVIAKVSPGVRWDHLQETAVNIITRGLVRLGILSGKVDQLIQDKAYTPFYMHNIGHWIGLDVHDVGAYKIKGEWRTLGAGIVLTVEPGIYISAGEPGVDPKWWNIGVRIEDDVLVTPTGHEVLTAQIPKTIEEIEAIIAGQTVEAR
ncbi:MAG: Xaa-Pro aminopeptidase [Gammaproteobacteria bacterium]|nr:Xaa-Pro aminopeptidase [Gammaproteobacteria bacterium]